MENIFQKIISGEIPSHKVYENDYVLAFLDINPVNKGHALVIPKKEVKDIYELEEKEAGELMKAIVIVSNAVKAGSGAPAINIVSNNGAEAGQEVFHLHFHIVPSYKKGEIQASVHHPYDGEDEMKSFAEKIKNAIN